MRVIKIVSLAVLVLVLNGCAVSKYGNFLSEESSVNQNLLADDVVQQLVEVYPPAKTKFEMQQVTDDIFGEALVKKMRQLGYAVTELDPEALRQHQYEGTRVEKDALERKEKKPATDAANATVAKLAAEVNRLGMHTYPMHYVVDNAENFDMYRVIIMIGDQVLTRPYLYQNNKLIPAGYWTRKE